MGPWAIYYDYHLCRLFFWPHVDALAVPAHHFPFYHTPESAAVVANEGGTHTQVVALDSLVLAYGNAHTQGVEEDSQDVVHEQDTHGAEEDTGLVEIGDNPMQAVAKEHDLLVAVVRGVVGEALALAHCYAVEARAAHEMEHSPQKPHELEAGREVVVERHCEATPSQLKAQCLAEQAEHQSDTVQFRDPWHLVGPNYLEVALLEHRSLVSHSKQSGNAECFQLGLAR